MAQPPKSLSEETWAIRTVREDLGLHAVLGVITGVFLWPAADRRRWKTGLTSSAPGPTP